MSPFPEDWIPVLWPSSLGLLAVALLLGIARRWEPWAPRLGVLGAAAALLCRLRVPGWLAGTDDPTFLSLHLLTLLGAGVLVGQQLLRTRRDPSWALLVAVPGADLMVVLGSLFLREPPPDEGAALPEGHRRAVWSVVAGALASGLLASLVVARVAGQQHAYGFELFVLLPLLVSFVVSSAFHHRARRTWSDTRALLLGTLLLCAAFLLVFGLEGIVCIVMAAPLAVAVVGAGVLLGRLFRSRRRRVPPALLLAAIPAALMGVPEDHAGGEPLFIIQTSIEIDAPPEAVWPHVVAYDWIPEPENPLFRGPLARPLRAVIEGEGQGARRACIFSTGAFDERVEVWEPNEVLRFAVVSNPPPMRELNPFHDVDAPHLHGFYQSKAGEYRLERLPEGRTRLTGTSWYSHGLRPAGYWRLWSDHLVGEVHDMVLGHVKTLSEKDAAQ